MATETDERILLDLYAHKRDRTALEALIARHLPFVYASALRQMHNDAHAAEDVAQAVCILLALKPPRLTHGANASAALRNWLFVTTRFAALNAIKMHNRRTHHERHAARLRTETMQPSIDAPSLDGLLDDALAQLNRSDRAGVILSYLENRTFAEVGRMLGVTEEAARKRVGRAIAKMRAFFTSRGMTVECAMIGSVLHAHAAVAPPFAIATSAASSAWAAAIGAGTSTTTSLHTAAMIANGARRMIALAKLKVAAALVLLATAVSIAAAPPILALVHRTAEPAGADAPKTQVQEPGKPLSVVFANDVSVSLLGITRIDSEAGANGKWWAADGAQVEKVSDRIDSQDDPLHTHQICLRVADVDGHPLENSVMTVVSTGNYSASPSTLNGVGTGGITLSTRVPEGKPLDVTVRVALGDWQAIITNDHPESSFVMTKFESAFMFAPVIDSPDGKATITVTDQLKNAERRIVVIDDNGESHQTKSDGNVAANGITQTVCVADIPAARVKAVQVLARMYDRVAIFKNVTLDPAHPTKPEAQVSEPSK